MSPVAFIDANVPMYAAGRPHPLKDPCQEVLLLISSNPPLFVTGAEVLQEMMHRYLALRMWNRAKGIFQRFSILMADRVEPLQVIDVLRAAETADVYEGLSARDLLHAAVMHRLGVRHIVSTDRGFDQISHIERLDPADVANWRGLFSLNPSES